MSILTITAVVTAAALSVRALLFVIAGMTWMFGRTPARRQRAKELTRLLAPRSSTAERVADRSS